MKSKIFKYRVISTQTWNGNKTQLISEHKSLKAAEKMVRDSEKKLTGNKYHIEEI